MRTPARAAPRVLYVAEPAGAWVRQPPAVVDCSVIAALLWAEPAAAEARRSVRHHALHAPVLLGCELANVARSKCRSGVPEAVARAGIEAFEKTRIELHPMDPTALFDLAQRLSLTAYDAAYLALAQALEAPLLTFDRRLAEAAERLLGSSDAAS